MSRLFAEYLMKTNGIDPETLSGVFESVPITAKYLSTRKEFDFKVLDFYGYVRGEVYWYFVKINEGDLLRMLRVDNYSDDEKNELYYHRLLGGSEGLEQIELDDDVFWGISILQYFFHISNRTLIELKRQAHLFKLYKVDSKNVELKKRRLHSNGGRKIGSLGEIEWQNIENAEAIIKTCVEKDRFLEYMELSRDLLRARMLPFGITGAKWKFYILRYKWKVSGGFVSRDLDYEQKLLEKNRVYKIFENLNFD